VTNLNCAVATALGTRAHCAGCDPSLVGWPRPISRRRQAFAVWLLWELWSAVEPKPLTDDCLRLLNDSFGRDWRNPFKWPWRRVLWAYGFTVVGATVSAGFGLMIWTLVASATVEPPTIHIDTSQSFRLGQ
jgi:hypothetical protein